MRVAISGASGLVGRALCHSLEADGHQVHRLVRRVPKDGEIGWSVSDKRIDSAALEGVDAVVHLAGESISQRWTAQAKSRILSSRVEGTRLLANALAGLERKPSVFVSASAIGVFGDGGQAEFTESSPAGVGFLAEVATAWEAAALPASEAGIRLVNFRVGIVMSTEGGALKEMLPAFRWGTGGPMGDGRQWISWIALADLVSAIRHVIDRAEISGPVHGVAPQAVTQRAFASALGSALGRPALVPAPGFAIRLMFGEMGQAILLEGQHVKPTVLAQAGFEWRYPDLQSCLTALLA
jgi:hypothetical protein